MAAEKNIHQRKEAIMGLLPYRDAAKEASKVVVTLLKEKPSGVPLDELIAEVGQKKGDLQPAAWGAVWRLADRGEISIQNGLVTRARALEKVKGVKPKNQRTTVGASGGSSLSARAARTGNTAGAKLKGRRRSE